MFQTVRKINEWSLYQKNSNSISFINGEILDVFI